MKRLLALSGACACPPKKSDLRYVWTAIKYPLQDGYLYKNSFPSKLRWAADDVYDPNEPNVVYKPELLLGNTKPDLLDVDTPHKTRLQLIHTEIDGEYNVTSDGPGIMMLGDPLIAAPSAEEQLRFVLETEFMILLPMSDDEWESRAVLIGWRPSTSGSERVDLLVVRDNEGETKLELVVQGSEAPETVVELPFEQWDLLIERQVIDLRITEGRVQVFVNGEKLHDGGLPTFGDGGGYMYMFSAYKAFQSFNIARPHSVRIERTRE